MTGVQTCALPIWGVVDLNCFNDYKLARAIARFPIPVITGIGHTANRSVSDEVAFADCITPTDAADLLIMHVGRFMIRLSELSDGLQSLVLDAVLHYKDQLEELAQNLNDAATGLLDDAVLSLDDRAARIRDRSLATLNEAGFGLKSALINIRHYASQAHQLHRQRLAYLSDKLKVAPSRFIQSQMDGVKRMESTCRHLDPANVLRRGFSITLVDGKAVKSQNDVQKGQILKTVLYEGSIESEVK